MTKIRATESRVAGLPVVIEFDQEIDGSLTVTAIEVDLSEAFDGICATWEDDDNGLEQPVEEHYIALSKVGASFRIERRTIYGWERKETP